MRNLGIAVAFIVIVALAGGLAWLAMGTTPTTPESPAVTEGVPGQTTEEAEDTTGEDSAGTDSAGVAAGVDAVPVTEADASAGMLAELRDQIAFTYLWNGRLGVWDGQIGERTIAMADPAVTPRVAPDGSLIAFARDGGIWIMNADGSDERLLVSEGEVEGMGNDETTARLHRMAWLPGTRRLLFNTALNVEMGIALSNDLHSVDVDSLDLAEILPAGAGGEFTVAPDGSAIAVVTPDRIRVVNPLGIAQRPDFPFAPVLTYSEFIYYPAVTWAQDSTALAVVIPHPEAVLQPEQPAALYRLDARGEAAPQIGTLHAAMPTYWIDPTLERVAFFQNSETEPEPADTDAGEAEAEAEGGAPVMPALVIAQVDGSDIRTYYRGAGQFVGWAPDGVHFVLATPDGEESIQIGRVGSDTLQPLAGLSHAFSHQAQWLDDQHLLVTVTDAASTTVVLASVAGALETLMEVDAGTFALEPLSVAP